MDEIFFETSTPTRVTPARNRCSEDATRATRRDATRRREDALLSLSLSLSRARARARPRPVGRWVVDAFSAREEGVVSVARIVGVSHRVSETKDWRTSERG